jgi:spore maturation protein CgeB
LIRPFSGHMMTNESLFEKYKAGTAKCPYPEPGSFILSRELPEGDPEMPARLKYNEGRSHYYFSAKNPPENTAGQDWIMDVDGRDLDIVRLVLKKEFEKGAALNEKFLKTFLYMSFCAGYGDARMENDGGEYLCLENGKWAVYARGRTGRLVGMNSTYDPEKEAAVIASRLPKDKPVIFIGAGMGWHIRSYMKLNPSASCALFEPHDYLYDIIKDQLDSGLIRIRDKEGISEFIKKGFEPFILPALKQSENGYSAAYDLSGRRTAPAIIISGRKPRITVVSPIYGGSYDMAVHTAGAFLKSGCDAQLIDASGYYPELRKYMDMGERGNLLLNGYVDTLMEEVYRKAVDSRPDIVFGMAQAPLSGYALERLKKAGIASAYWFVEDYKFIKYWERIHRLYDWFFVIQDGEFVKKLRDSGGNPEFMPVAAPDEGPGALPDAIYRSLASFVGAPYRNRIKIMEELSGLDISIYGEGWSLSGAAGSVMEMVKVGDRRITGEQVRSIYSGSKININLHSSMFHDGIETDGDFINPRTFEILSCGGFEITDNRTGLERYLTPGKEIEVYSTVGELREKIEYYTKNPEAAARIARNGAERTLREHTYRNRINDMLKIMMSGRDL